MRGFGTNASREIVWEPWEFFDDFIARWARLDYFVKRRQKRMDTSNNTNNTTNYREGRANSDSSESVLAHTPIMDAVTPVAQAYPVKSEEEQRAEMERMGRRGVIDSPGPSLAELMRASAAGEIIPSFDMEEEADEIDGLIYDNSYSAVSTNEVAGFEDCFYPDQHDTNPVGVRYSPDGRDKYWFDKITIKVDGKDTLVYKLDRAASKPE